MVIDQRRTCQTSGVQIYSVIELLEVHITRGHSEERGGESGGELGGELGGGGERWGVRNGGGSWRRREMGR